MAGTLAGKGVAAALHVIQAFSSLLDNNRYFGLVMYVSGNITFSDTLIM